MIEHGLSGRKPGSLSHSSLKDKQICKALNESDVYRKSSDR
jgi:hypothetical protein